LQERGISVLATREPGGSPGAEAVRSLLVSGDPARWDGETEALLMVAARRDHIVQTVGPALGRGQWVVSDRFSDSTVAYQGYGRGVNLGAIERLHEFAIGDVRPDLTVVLDLPVDIGLGRSLARQTRRNLEDRFERAGSEFHERLRRGYLAIAAADPVRCRVIDGNRSADEVHRAVAAVVAQRFDLA
jgi:dTMP kinase